MKLTSFPVHRPVLTSVIYIIVIVIGMFSLWRLPIDLMPEIEYPRLTVGTSYGNAGPQEVEELITKPIESALAGVQGIEEITSSSAEGQSSVRISFVWGTNLDEASNDIRDRIDRILRRLPEDVERPTIRKFDVSSYPVLILGVSSDLDQSDIRQFLEDQVQYRLERVNGVASVDIRGGRQKEIQVSLRRTALEALDISPDMVVSTILQENKNMPAGTVDKGSREIIVRTFAEYESLADVKNAIIAVRNGIPVTVGEIADVSEGLEEIRRIVRINGRPGIQLAISKQSGTNTVAVANAVKKEVRRINQDFPQISMIPRIDTSKYISDSIKSVGIALLMGGIIAIIILLMFLRNISSTLIIAITIPVSVVATFALVYFGGFTLNMMTFGGLALGIGMLVDNAIVVLDSIFHHREQGEKPVEGAVIGASEVASAVTASTLTTLVVFFPVIFIRGISGIMFRQLAYVVSFSLVCSLFTALTLVPMLTSKFLKMTNPVQRGRRLSKIQKMFVSSEKFYQRIESYYGRMISWALHHRKIVLLCTVLLFIGSILMIPLVGTELMPASDEGEVRVNVKMEVGARIEPIDSVVLQIESIIRREVPEAEHIISNTGGSWRSGGNTGSIRVALVEKSKRSRSDSQIANSLRKSLSNIPGTTIRVREGQGLFIMRMGSGGRQEVEIEVRGYDLETGENLANQISKLVESVDGVTDVDISREEGMPEYDIIIDRKKAADLGLSASRIGSAIEIAMGGRQASFIRRDGKEYPIIVRLTEEDRKDIGQLKNLTIINNNGKAIPLSAVAQFHEGSGPLSIERRDRERIITIDANYFGRDMGSVVNDIRNVIRQVSVPSDFAVIIRGDYEEQQKAQRELLVGLLLAILLVYLVMAGQFESFKDPLIVLFSIPVALIGVVGLLYITATPFSVQAYIGCIILAGIVVNNAIVLIDYINRLRRNYKYELFKAIETAGVRRLRPIMMTALTTVLGLLPLSLALGEGGEAQAPMARVVIGGLLTSTIITLILIPVIYSYIEEKHMKKRMKKANELKAVVPAILLTFLISPLFTTLNAESNDTLKLSLQDVLHRAANNNPLVRIEKIDLDIAKTVVRENKYTFEPVVSGEFKQDYNLSDESQKPDYQGLVAVEGVLPTGTGIRLQGSGGRVSQNRSSLNAGLGSNSGNSDIYQGNYELKFTQALLAGGGLGVNLAPLRKASLDMDIEKEELAGYAQNLLAQTEQAYWGLYLAMQEIAIHKRSLELAERLLYESQERLNVGHIASLDLVGVKAEVASRKKSLIDAQTVCLQKKYQLAYLLNDSVSLWNENMVLIDTPPKPELSDSLDLYIESALKYRADLRQANYLLRKGELDIVTTRNGLLPKLDLFISLSGTSYANSFGDMFKEGDSDNDNRIAAGLSLSYPVTNGKARNRHNRAMLSREKYQLSIKNLENLIHLDVRVAWSEVKRTWQQIEAASIALELQEQNSMAEQAKLNAGKSTEYMVLQKQRDLISAQLDKARAEVEYISSITNLYLKDGTLLERRGVNSL
ncbi:MAG TPA: efflux RND transporter permease subunit [Chitinispirillaceae bacterium]|nr:efflux RND transporter permease subunit [Chitinispirillaceae bacterium]